MEKIPVFARGVAKTAIHRYAIEKGHTIISNTVVDTAVGHILPKGAMDAMRACGWEPWMPPESIAIRCKPTRLWPKDLMGSTLSNMMTQVVEEKPVNSAGTQAYLDRMSQNYFVCDGCGYIGKGDTPVKCPVCSAEGNRFKQVDKTIFEAAAKAEGASKPTWPTMTSPCSGPRMPKKPSAPCRRDSNVDGPKPRSKRVPVNLA